MKWFVCSLCIVLEAAFAADVLAGAWTKVVDELVTRAAGTEARNTERIFAMREAEEASQVLTKQLASSADEAVVLRRFERLQGADNALRAEFKALAPEERKLVVELGEGVQRLYKLYPGPEGTKILQHLNTTGMAQSRTYGDFVFDGMAFVQSDDALTVLRGPIPEEARATIASILGLKSSPLSLGEREVAELWKSTVRKTGHGAGEFWRVYIAPHKGKWFAGGLLVTYLAMPERFHDAAGKLTAYGAKEIGKLLGDSTLGLGRGFLEGIGDSIARQFALAPIATISTIVAIVCLLLLAVPRMRRFVWQKFFRPIMNPIATSPLTRPNTKMVVESSLSSHTPLQE